jgi:hypothetical protein
MPAVIDGLLATVSRKNHQMCCADVDFMVTPRTTVDLRGT